MIFISKSPELELGPFRRDVVNQTINQHGQTAPVIVQPAVRVLFRPKSLTGSERTRADMRFRQLNPTHPYGATPYSDTGIMGSQFNEEEISPSMPESYVGFNPVHMLGKFDSASDLDCSGQPEEPGELRRMVEEWMLLPLTGIDDIYILLDAVVVERPWPAYPLEGQGRHAVIEKMVRDGGYDPRVVITFEEAQEKPGAGVISRMEALLAEQGAEKAEQDALSARIQ